MPKHTNGHLSRNKDGVKVATVGISAFAFEQLTDLVYLELPEVGRDGRGGRRVRRSRVGQGGELAVQPRRRHCDEVNTGLPDRLETLSEDPYGGGWIAKIQISDEACLSKLLDYGTYQKQCAEEG